MNKREAGRKGGLATVQKHGRDHMAKIGRKGAETFHKRYIMIPVELTRFAIFTRKPDQSGRYRFIAYIDGGNGRLRDYA